MSSDQEYKFDPKFDWWTPSHYDNYEYIKREFQGKEGLRFLEVGIFEGRSTVWFVENIFLADKCRYIAVEPDPAPNMAHNFDVLEAKTGIRPAVVFDYSERALPQMIIQRYRMDFALIDGDHNAQGVLRDAVMVWEILKVGGILLFDDYEMEATDPWHYISHKEFSEHPRANFQHPRAAIDAFLSIYRGLYEKVIDNFQVGVRKTAELGAKNLDHGDNSQGENGEGSFEYHQEKG